MRYGVCGGGETEKTISSHTPSLLCNEWLGMCRAVSEGREGVMSTRMEEWIFVLVNSIIHRGAMIATTRSILIYIQQSGQTAIATAPIHC